MKVEPARRARARCRDSASTPLPSLEAISHSAISSSLRIEKKKKKYAFPREEGLLARIQLLVSPH
jgi:hypothetical protein